jgi:hypothetical protein
MHGPNHLFCAGCNMEDDALAAAAWAGTLAARGQMVDAEKWAKTARERNGRPIIGSVGGLHLRIIGEDPTVEDLDLMIEMLKLSRDAFKRRADKQAEKLAAAAATTGTEGAAPATLPHDSAPAGTSQGSDAGTREREAKQ